MQTVRLTTMTENTPSPDKTCTHDAKKSFKSEERRFQYDDRKYIDRGQLWMLQISQEIMTQGVEKLNCGKVGRPYVFSNACFAAAFLFRNATGIEYRQLQGVAEAIVGRENAPTYSAFQNEPGRRERCHAAVEREPCRRHDPVHHAVRHAGSQWLPVPTARCMSAPVRMRVPSPGPPSGVLEDVFQRRLELVYRDAAL